MDGALADFDRAIALDPQQVEFYANRGKAWLLKHEIERGLSDVNHALKLAPNFAEAFALRGAVWFHKQDYTRCGL